MDNPVYLFFLVIAGVFVYNIWFAGRKSQIEQHKIREDHRIAHRDMAVKEAKLEIDRIRYGLTVPVVPPVAAPAPITAAVVPAAVIPSVATAVALPAVAAPSQEELVPVGETTALHADSVLVIALNDECSVVVESYLDMNQALRELTFTGSLAKMLGKSNHSLDRVRNLSSLTDVELRIQSEMLAVEELSAMLSGEIGRFAASQQLSDLHSRKAA